MNYFFFLVRLHQLAGHFMNRVRFTVLSLLLMLGYVSCFSQDKTTTKYNTIIDMLRGEPGLVISTDKGGGTMPAMYIRGIGTNSGQTQPLFVVDGIQTDNIMYIQPEDVYSINVIKDGTSAIYGMQGANGVIEITTRSHMEAEKRAAAENKTIRKTARKSKKEARKSKKNSN